MASYEIKWKHSAEREIKNIDRQYIPRIIKSIGSLAIDPFPFRHRKLHGVESSYRIRVGDYRIIYEVDEENKRVIIYHVRHRSEAYRK